MNTLVILPSRFNIENHVFICHLYDVIRHVHRYAEGKHIVVKVLIYFAFVIVCVGIVSAFAWGVFQIWMRWTMIGTN